MRNLQCMLVGLPTVHSRVLGCNIPLHSPGGTKMWWPFPKGRYLPLRACCSRGACKWLFLLHPLLWQSCWAWSPAAVWLQSVCFVEHKATGVLSWWRKCSCVLVRCLCGREDCSPADLGRAGFGSRLVLTRDLAELWFLFPLSPLQGLGLNLATFDLLLKSA